MTMHRALFSITILVALWLPALTPPASAYFKPLPPPESALTLHSLPGWPSWIGTLGEPDLPPRLVVTGATTVEGWPSWIGTIPWLQ